MFSNLLLYELILIITGSILFLALIFAFIWYVIKNRSILTLLPFFIIPIAMIAWPTINSISYEDGKVEIKKLAEEVENDPADTTKRRALQDALNKISEKRSEQDVQALIYQSQAQSALGHYEAAEVMINNALIIEPDNTEALQTKDKILEQKETQSRFTKDVSELQQNLNKLDNPAYKPTDTDFTTISQILTDIKVPVYTDEQSLLTISKALGTVNDKETSLTITDKVMEVLPQSESAREIKTDIETGELKPIKTREYEIKNNELKKLDKVVIEPNKIQH